MVYIALLENDNDVIIKGNRCITTVQDLYKVITLKDTSDIIITKEFAEKYFTPSGLFAFKENVNVVNKHINIKIDADVVDFDLRKIDRIKHYKTVEELTYVLQKYGQDVIDTIQTLCDFYSSAYTETLLANNKVSSLQLVNSQLQSQYAESVEMYNKLLDNYNTVSTKLHTIVSRINYSYSKQLDVEKALNVSHNKYTKVLYIKERTRVHFVDTLVYYLQEILKTLYSVPTRVVVIEPFYAYDSVKLYPHYIPHWKLSYKDVYKADILMVGFQPSLMEDILYNASSVEYLIILDRCHLEQQFVTGDNVEVITTMSDVNDNYDNIKLSRIISYEYSTLTIQFIKDFKDLGIEEKMIKYSSMPIMKSLLDLIERR
ncbi:MAG: hypothetical protein LBS29_04535 [Endomicrobium sp.]|jgi:hypothetical protein|nr:hypothetical protein [Endomicrobium sp.]